MPSRRTVLKCSTVLDSQIIKEICQICSVLFLKIYLFSVLTVVGLCCCAWVFSSCSGWGLLFVVVPGLFIVVMSLVAKHRPQEQGLQLLKPVGSAVVAPGLPALAQQLWYTNSVAPQHVGSSWTGGRTAVPCTTRRILNHWTTREALFVCVLFLFLKDNICAWWKKKIKQ